jgi:predicted phosphodiesterase
LEWHPKIPENRKLQVFQISDLHYGAKTHIRDAFDEMVDKIHRTRFTAWVGHGDLIENNTKTSVGEGVYEETKTPEQQMEEISDILYPIRKKCLGIGRGNHEKRSNVSDGHDLVNRLCRELRVPRLMDHSIHTFVFDDTGDEVSLLVTHGRTGATTDAGRRRAVENLTHIYHADGFMYGHVHGLDTWKLTITGPREDFFRHYAINGSFMAYIDSYAQTNEYRQGLPGYITTMVGREGLEFVKNPIRWPHIPIKNMEGVRIG